MTVQWKAMGSMVGSWNMLIYGIGFYVMEKISGNRKFSYSKMTFFFYFLRHDLNGIFWKDLNLPEACRFLTRDPLIPAAHLPVVVDPSHGTGRKQMVTPMARAAAAVGANGIMVDVHDRPKEALCDGPQAISPEELTKLVPALRRIASIL